MQLPKREAASVPQIATYPAFAAALLFAGFAFTACDDDDDNSAPGTKPTIKFENVIPTKNYVQSGSFAAVAPGKTTSFTFYAAKGQRLMFAAMYANSNDLFFAPENPGIQLFNDSGVPYTGIIADAVKLWDNGTFLLSSLTVTRIQIIDLFMDFVVQSCKIINIIPIII